MVVNDAYTTLRKQLRSRSLGRLYVFYGQESYLREHYLSECKKHLIAEGTDCFNVERMEGKGLSLTALGDAAAQAPLMGERRLLRVTDFDFTKIPAAEREAWAVFFAELPEWCCLIFDYDSLSFKKDKRNAAIEALDKHGLCVAFETPEEPALIAWLARHASSHEKNITADNCRHLIFITGGSLRLLKNEMDKLAAYTSGPEITRKEIDLLVTPVPDAAAFTLGESVAAGRTREAAELLRTLKALREPPEMLLGAVAKTLRGVYAARLARENRKSAEELRVLMGYRSMYPAQKLLQAAEKRDLPWCRKALCACLRADRMLKRGAYSDRERVMEWLLATLA